MKVALGTYERKDWSLSDKGKSFLRWCCIARPWRKKPDFDGMYRIPRAVTPDEEELEHLRFAIGTKSITIGDIELRSEFSIGLSTHGIQEGPYGRIDYIGFFPKEAEEFCDMAEVVLCRRRPNR